LPSARPSSSIAPTGKRKKSKGGNNFFRAYLTEDTTAELWSTGNFDTRVGDSQRQSAEFSDVFSIDENTNVVNTAVEGRADEIEFPDIGLPADR
jgi:hypothetical protein